MIVEMVCPYCGEKFQYKKKKYIRRSCGRKGCFAASHKKEHRKPIVRKCEGCGIDFITCQAEIDRGRGKYHSIECYRQSLDGKNNPNWKGGIRSLTKTLRAHDQMKAWIKTVLEKDNYQCFYCGKRGDLHAHHIVPFAGILDSYKFYNGKLDLEGLLNYEILWDTNNGVALCHSCHNKFPKKITNETVFVPPELLERAMTNGIKIEAWSIEDVVKHLGIEGRVFFGGRL